MVPSVPHMKSFVATALDLCNSMNSTFFEVNKYAALWKKAHQTLLDMHMFASSVLRVFKLFFVKNSLEV